MKIQTRFPGWVIATIGAALLLASPAQASIIVSIDSVFGVGGTSGNTLDVTLQNTGPSDITVGGFGFEIQTTDTDIVFDGTDINTTLPYIFMGDSLFGPMINLLSPGQTMDGSDVALSGGDLVAAGATVGLGHVTFHVLPGAVLGPVDVTFVSNGTSLSQPDTTPITIDTFKPGQITVSTPEPVTIALLGLGLLGVLGLRKRAIGRL